MIARLKSHYVYRKDKRFKNAYTVDMYFETEHGKEFRQSKFIGPMSSLEPTLEQHKIVEVGVRCAIQFCDWRKTFSVEYKYFIQSEEYPAAKTESEAFKMAVDKFVENSRKQIASLEEQISGVTQLDGTEQRGI